MKKIAVISDIHGNKIALESVLEDIKQQNCDKILCLGDLVLAGPQPLETIEFVREISSNWEIIQGNTDNYLGNFSEEIYNLIGKNAPIMANSMADDVKLINKNNQNYLKNLPLQKTLEIENVKILMVHGSPRNQSENIFPNMPLPEIEKILENVQEDLILCGHTHIPCGYQTNSGQTLVNVGSVGRPMDENTPCYALFTLKNGAFTVEHRRIAYNINLAADLIRKRHFLGCKELAEMLLNPVSRHI